MADQYGYTAQLLEGLFSGDKGQLRQQRQQMQLSQLQQMQQQRESEMEIQAKMMENQALLYEQAKKDVVRDKDKEYLRDMLNKGITYMQSEIDQKYNGSIFRNITKVWITCNGSFSYGYFHIHNPKIHTKWCSRFC